MKYGLLPWFVLIVVGGGRISVAIDRHLGYSFRTCQSFHDFHFFSFNFFDFTQDNLLVIVPVTLELFTHLFKTIDGCLHSTLMAVSHISTLEFLFNGAVGDAVSLEDKPRAVVQVAVTRLLWKVGGVPCVRIRQQQVQSNQNEDKDQDWITVCHYKNRRLFFKKSWAWTSDNK